MDRFADYQDMAQFEAIDLQQVRNKEHIAKVAPAGVAPDPSPSKSGRAFCITHSQAAAADQRGQRLILAWATFVNKPTREPTKDANRPTSWRAEQQRCLGHDWPDQPSD